jgi:hypothetical protein
MADQALTALRVHAPARLTSSATAPVEMNQPT